MDTELYLSVLDKIVDGVVVIDRQGSIIKINNTILTMFGYNNTELIGKNVKILMPEPHRSNHDTYISKYKETGKKNILDTIRGLYAVKKDGTMFPMELSISELNDNYFLGIIRDMTIMDNITDPLITIDSSGIILKGNSRVEELFGYKMEELLGVNINILMPEPYKSNHDKYLSNYQNTGIKKVIGKIRNLEAVKKDGTIFPMELSVSQLSKHIFVGIIRDKTKEFYTEKIKNELEEKTQKLEKYVVEIEKEKEEKIKLAESVAKAKSSFIANMSHEIRTPMNGIFGMLSLLNNSENDDNKKDYINTCIKSAEHLLSILDDILLFSKAEAEAIKLEMIRFNLNETIEDVINIISNSVKQNTNLEIVYYVRENVPHNIIGDPGRLRQILMNLMGNAVKFTDIGEVALEVRLLTDDPLIMEFSVIDTGIGISEEQQINLFKAFTQADSSTSRVYGGTGLGLSICKQLVKLYGGDIKVNSRLGSGTTFTFTAKFEIDKLKSSKKTYGLEDDELELIKTLRILVIDDNATNCIAFRELFTSMGCFVETSRIGSEGINKLKIAKVKNESFNLLLLDYNMPNLNGVQICKILNDMNMNIKIILLCSGFEQQQKLVLSQNNISSFITKPIRKAQLLKLIPPLISDKFGKTKKILEEKNKLKYDENILKNYDGKNATIIIAEDNNTNRMALAKVLRATNHNIIEAINGLEVIEELEKNDDIKLIFMDIHMPLMDGIEATKIIKSRGYYVPIVALTADISPETNIICNKIGMIDFLNKPVKLDKLINVLDKIINKSNQVLRVLVVDDVKTNREIVDKMLLKINPAMTIYNSSNGIEALDILGRYDSNIDIILMDVRMDIMDGIDATREIRRLYGNKHDIIGLTASTDLYAIEECKNVGMDSILQKPISFDDLSNLIYKYMKSEKHHQKNKQNDNKKNIDKKVQNNENNKKNDANDIEVKKLFDLSILKSFLMEDIDSIKTFIKEWKDESKEILDNMKINYTKKEYLNIVDLAHKLKGSSLNIGAFCLSNRANNIEQMAKNNKYKELKKEIELIDDEFIKTVALIDNLL